MGRTIDERVVEMRFDNKQFEDGASETMSTLQKLKKSLDFTNVGKSFEQINVASNRVDLAGLDRVITGAQNKFIALGLIATSTLNDISKSFMGIAKNWVSSLTIDPIKTGFQEYETQINAVQTILANTQKEGTNIKDVNAALDELNTYADKTIYNFTEMTRNIGTFTAAGVDLKTSVGAIQGIANLAAVSGSNSQQASTAMYQLSQALATGTVKLMDWNSVVNAGMGGQLFQDALKETSRLLGTGVDAAIEAEGSFRESLKTGWLTTEVLTETLKKFTTSGAAEQVAEYTGLTKEAIESELELAKSTYGEADAIDKAAESLAKKSGKNKDEIADALRFAQTAEDAATKVKTFTQLIDTLKEALQSGWSQSFRIIIGDFEEAKELFTEISDAFGAVISASSDARNKLLSEVFNKKDAEDYIASLANAPKEAVTELQTVAKEAGTTSKLFKDTLNEFTEGDKVLNNVMTHLIDMTNSGKEVTTYLSEITGKSEETIKKLDNLGRKFGYSSDEFKRFADTLSNGNPEIASTITYLLEMNDALTKPTGRELLIDSLRNAMKGLVSLVKPVGDAFRQVFPPATADQVYGILEGFNKLTKKLIISEKNSKNLKDAFAGLFDIVKLLRDSVLGLIKIIIPVERPINSLADGILDLVGFLGRSISAFAKGVRSSEILTDAFVILQDASKALMKAFSKLTDSGVKFVKKLSNMKGTTKLIESINNAFTKLYKVSSPYLNKLGNAISDFINKISEFDGINVDTALNSISDAFGKLSTDIDKIDFKFAGDAFDKFRSKIKNFTEVVSSNEGLNAFIKNLKEYGEELKTAFTWDNLLDRMEKIMSVFGKFFKWVKTVAAPAFEDFSAGAAVAGAGGIGIVYAMIKLSNAFEGISEALQSIPDLLGSVKDTLVSYQKELKASSILKISSAIGILAVALVFLSFADTDRLMSAAVALTIVSGVLLFGISRLLDAINKGQEMNVALLTFAKGFRSAMRSFGASLVIRSIGKAAKDFAMSIDIIAAAIVGLGVMYKKDKDSLLTGVELISMIGGTMVAIAAIFTILSTVASAKGVASIGTSILMLTLSLGLVVGALSNLMKIELPKDYDTKLAILGGLFAGLAAMALVLGLAAGVAGGNQLPKIAGTIRSLAVLLVGTVIAMKILFDMELPKDYKVKLAILGGIFTAFGALIVLMALAAGIAQGNGFKAGGTILAMAAFLVVVVGALFVLTLIPTDKIFSGVVALGGILIALGVALYGAGKITDEGAAKAVTAMAATVGVIVVALAVLSMIPWKKLVKAVASLGVVLLTLAYDFQSLSKVKSKKALPAILGMIGAVTVIAFSLYVLSEQPWEGMLAAAAAMSATLLAFGKTFQTILGKEWSKYNPQKIGTFLLLTLAVIPIGAALAVLANQPWAGLLAATVAMSATLLAFKKIFPIILGEGWSKNNVKKIGTFLLLTVAVIPIAAALAVLANQPWAGMLAAAAGLSLTLMALSGCFAIISKVTVNPASIAAVVAGSASLLLIAAAISMLVKYDATALLTSCLALSSVLLVITGVMAACAALSGVIGPALLGVLGLGAVIVELGAIIAAIGGLAQIPGLKWIIDEGASLLKQIGTAIGGFFGGILGGIVGGVMESISSQLPQLGLSLSQFMINLTPFIMGAKMIDSSVLESVGMLSKVIIALTAAELINGIAGLFDISLVDVATELSAFMVALSPFIMNSKLLNPESMQACKYLAEMIIALTGAELLAGIGEFLGIRGSLSGFGAELASLGPDIKQFAEDVKDIKPEAVEGAAAAAELMANLANKLPAQDGWLQTVLGNKSLSDFADQLVDFGPSIAEFADTVKDVDPDSVEGAAAAAEIMAKLSEKLPAQDGWIQKVFGDKSLADFGAELSAFGPDIVKFANQVKNVTASSVTGVSLATAMMATLADGLPSTDNLFEKIFGGGQMTISEFGEELIAFGKSMSDFSSSLSGVDTEQMGKVVTVFKDLVDIANLANGASGAGLVNFTNQLGSVSSETINNFIQNFSSAGTKAAQALVNNINTKKPLAISAIKNLCTAIVSQLKTSLPASTFTKTGQGIILGITNGINAKKPLLISTVKNICTVIVSNFKNNLSESTFKSLGNSVISAFKSSMSQSAFKEIGANAALGLKQGIESKISEVGKAAAKAAKQSVDSAKKELDEHSPSKVMKQVGQYFSIGLANGIIDQIKTISKAGTKAADEAIDPVKKAVDSITEIVNSGFLDDDPVIRPVMDLSNVQNGVNEISSLMNRTYDLSSVYNKAMDVSASFNSANKSRTGRDGVGSSNADESVKYEFIQNNYSPKALNRSEIYRQTNNQFSQLKRAVKIQ